MKTALEMSEVDVSCIIPILLLLPQLASPHALTGFPCHRGDGSHIADILLWSHYPERQRGEASHV